MGENDVTEFSMLTVDIFITTFMCMSSYVLYEVIIENNIGESKLVFRFIGFSSMIYWGR